jgi:hypothetical protein
VRKAFRDFGLSITLAALWVTNWVAYGVTLALQPGPFSWVKFWEGTFENNQSEFLQLLSFVVLTSVLVHRGSAESKDGDERMERKIDEVLRRLD